MALHCGMSPCQQLHSQGSPGEQELDFRHVPWREWSERLFGGGWRNDNERIFELFMYNFLKCARQKERERKGAFLMI